MATSVIMPKLGMDMSDCTLVEWLKGDGEPVLEGESVAVVETDKISIEIPAETAGTLRHVAPTGSTHPIGAPIAYILAPGEALPAGPSAGAGGLAPDEDPTAASVADRPIPAQPSGSEGRVTASPVARKLAAELGVDLAQVPASGARITRQDVQAFHDSRMQNRSQPPGEAGPRVLPLSANRQVTARRLVESLQTMAQLTLTRTADVTTLVQLRDSLCERWQLQLSYTTLLVRAVAVALGAHPRLNSQLQGTELILHDEVNVGVAVALDDGLIVPIVKRAHSLDLRQIHTALTDLAARARAGALTPDDVSGGTFTLTNLGMYGVEFFTPIINPPQVAILGIGRIIPSLGLSANQVVERQTMALSLSIDHRVVDGAPGARFLASLTGLLEQPDSLP
jgi:pyruvate dehydrogenase E2 component (dihydrolipoamide acetyltransferase)